MIRNASMMYLRPGMLYKEFIVVSERDNIGSFGRPKPSEETTDTMTGTLSEADQRTVERWKQNQHPITHTIESPGKPKAKAGSKLILGDRVFMVHGVEDCGGLGISTLYYAEERFDVK